MSDQVRLDFLNAIAAIERGQPTSKKLTQRIRQGKSVAVNFSNVATEAGRSRTLIGKNECDYPDIRKKIKTIMEGKLGSKPEGGARGPSSGGQQAIIDRLRAEKAVLKLERSKLASELGAALNKIASMAGNEDRRSYDARRAQTKRHGKTTLPN